MGLIASVGKVLVVDGARWLRCILRPDDPRLGRRRDSYINVVVGGQPGYISSVFIETAARFTVDRIFGMSQGLLANRVHDKDVFATSGFDDPWAEAYSFNANLMFTKFKDQHSSAALLDAGLHFTQRSVNDARGLLRQFLYLADTAGVRSAFGSLTRATSRSKLYWAANEILGRARDERLKARLFTAGVTQEMLDQVAALMADLHQGVTDRSKERADLRAPNEVDLLKGMVYGDGWLLSRVARARLPAERAALYRPAVLLGTGRKKPHKNGPTPETGTTAPATQHGHGQHGSTGHHAAGTGTHHKPQPGPVPVAPGTNPGAPGVQAPAPGTTTTTTTPAGVVTVPPAVALAPPPGPGPAPPAPGTTIAATTAPAPGAMPVIPPIYFAGLDKLAPGTVVGTMQTPGGPTFNAVVQIDHSVMWVPAAPAATPATPTGRAAVPAAPDKRGKGRARRHRHHTAK